MSDVGELVDFEYSNWGRTRSVFITEENSERAKYRCFEMYDGTPAVEVATPEDNYLFVRENGRFLVYRGDGLYDGSFPDVLSEDVREEPGIDPDQVKALLAGENSFEPLEDGLPEP